MANATSATRLEVRSASLLRVRSEKMTACRVRAYTTTYSESYCFNCLVFQAVRRSCPIEATVSFKEGSSYVLWAFVLFSPSMSVLVLFILFGNKPRLGREGVVR